MSEGVANVITLYDKDGHPLTVNVVSGDYVLVTTDPETQGTLDEILLVLRDLVEIITSGRG